MVATDDRRVHKRILKCNMSLCSGMRTIYH